MKHPRQRSTHVPGRRFTLVELLTVIAILLILIAMLLPALEETRVRAQVVVCASNLYQYGTVAKSYAADKDRKYPLIANSSNNPYAWSMRNGTDGSGGVSASLLRDDYAYGGDVVTCPARDMSKEDFSWAGYTWSDSWKLWYTSSWTRNPYLYVAGAMNYNHYAATELPAAFVRIARNEEPDNRLLAADSIMTRGTGTSYDANHGSRNRYYAGSLNTGLVNWQNLVFADGHSETKDRTYYNNGVDTAYLSTMGAFWEGSPKQPR